MVAFQTGTSSYMPISGNNFSIPTTRLAHISRRMKNLHERA